MDLTERTLSSEMIYSGRVVNLRIDTVQMPDGRITKREIVEHTGAVAIVPLVDHENLLLVRQFRRAVGEALIEIPAGTLEDGEDALACAARELEEETGYTAGSLEPLFSQYLAPGYSQEVLHVFLAKDLKPSKQNMDEDENLELMSVPIGDIDAMVRDGRIKDAKSIAGLLMALRLLGR